MKRSSSVLDNNDDNKKAKIHPFFQKTSFDLDGTLIKTKSGNVHSKDSRDWVWWHSSIPEKLKQLHSEDYKIVIFSNQNGLKNDQRINEFKAKVTDILDQLPMPVLLFASLHKDVYRKPMKGMWDELVQEYNDVEIDLKNSFYVGDAAGRPVGWKPNKKKDHSCVDRKFAANIDIKFYTPEKYFTNENEAEFSWGPVNIMEYSKPSTESLAKLSSLVPKNKSAAELILLIGAPASGKSSFAQKYIIPNDYEYINQDTLKTKAKCINACEKALKEEKSAVIDNTNSTVEARSQFIKVAKKYNIPVRCFMFTADIELCKHNNYYRSIYKKERPLLSEIVFRVYSSQYQPPTLKEGFSKIESIDFIFSGDDEDFIAWKKWYI
ncbi:unnamed protein product [Cunninghamella echinulata]